jgi:DNA-binding MarR family transcriptional regulator
MPHQGTDNAGVTRLADRLEAAGLGVRQGGRDRRSITLEPTEAGAALAPELEKALGGAVRQLLSGLSEEELAQLTGLLRRVMASAAELDRQ